MLWYRRFSERKPAGNDDEEEIERGAVLIGFPTLAGKPFLGP